MDCSNTAVPGIETFVETFQNHHFHKDLKPAMLVGVGPSIIQKKKGIELSTYLASWFSKT